MAKRQGEEIERCKSVSTLQRMIGGKWKIPIICALKQDGPTRYNELKRKISGITNTMLASSLKELESSGLIYRRQYDEMPVRVEYSLAELAEGLIPILSQLAMWGQQMHELASPTVNK